MLKNKADRSIIDHLCVQGVW